MRHPLMLYNLGLFLVFASPVAAETTRNLRPSELARIVIWEKNSSSVKLSRDGQDVTFAWNVSIRSFSTLELSEVDIRIAVVKDGKTLLVSRPVAIRSFDNFGFGTTGSLLPYEVTLLTGPYPATIPARAWTSDVGLRLEICGAKTFTGPVDLHDVNHLYTKLANSSTKDNLALLRKDPSLLRVRNREGKDTSSIAFTMTSPEVIKYVVLHGGTWTPKSKKGATVMHYAALNGWPGVLDLALAHGGDVNAKTYAWRRTPLIKAIRCGYSRNVLWLLKHGADPNSGAEVNYPSAFWAIYDKQAQSLKYLVDAGANRHYHDSQGIGWMHVGTMSDQFLPILVSYGLSVDDRDPKFGVTPLMVAERLGRPEASIWLLQHGANPDLKDVHGKTAYDCAAQSNTLHTDRFFRERVRKFSRF